MNSKEEFTVQMKRKVAEIEEILKEYLPKPEGYQKVIMEAMEYSLMAGGKRLRPMLMRETSRLFGDETEALCPFMAALEMIHTYSLVHDDLRWTTMNIAEAERLHILSMEKIWGYWQGMHF